MPSLNLRFDRFDRPIVSVELKPGLVYQQWCQINAPHQVPSVRADFLVDTAAEGCIVEEDVIAAWRLPKAVPVLVASGSGPAVDGYRYILSLTLREDGQHDRWHQDDWKIETVGTGHFDGHCKGLIGVDLLKLGSLTYSGPAGICTLSW